MRRSVGSLTIDYQPAPVVRRRQGETRWLVAYEIARRLRERGISNSQAARTLCISETGIRRRHAGKQAWLAHEIEAIDAAHSTGLVQLVESLGVTLRLPLRKATPPPREGDDEDMREAS